MWLSIEAPVLYLVPGFQYCQASHYRTHTRYIHQFSIADCADAY